MSVTPPSRTENFDSFLTIVQALRGPEGCPWDKEQTPRSLTPYAIEEAHELAEAIESGDDKEVIGELGDLLLQVVLHAEIARQEGRFTISDVIKGISEKMIRRHPHVFSTTEVGSSADVLANWSQLKAKEKAEKAAAQAATTSTTGGAQASSSSNGPNVAPSTAPMRFDIPVSLPALARSHKIGDKTARVKFDWPNALEVLKKVDEEIDELKAEINKLGANARLPDDQSKETELRTKLEHELGDVLFSVAQLGRHLGLESERALRVANTRFEERFFTMKNAIEAGGKKMEEMQPDELEVAWQTVKATLAQEK